MRVYIAGPMRGIEQYNFPEFDRAKLWLEQRGVEAVSPADLDRELGFDPHKGLDEQGFCTKQAIVRDVHASLECDGAVVLPGWQFSRGAGVEVMLMRFLQCPVWCMEKLKTLPEGTDIDWCESEIHPIEGMAIGYWGEHSSTFRDAWNGHRGERQQQIAEVAFDVLQNASLRIAQTLLQKNHDYGDSVFHRPALAEHLSQGEAIAVRMSDKLSRLRTLSKQDAQVSEESADDTFRDLIGYCLLWLVQSATGHRHSRDELAKAQRDMDVHGVAYMLDGQRVDPSRVIRLTPTGGTCERAD